MADGYLETSANKLTLEHDLNVFSLLKADRAVVVAGILPSILLQYEDMRKCLPYDRMANLRRITG